MKIDNIDNYVRGWIVGLFDPAMIKKDYEIGIKYYNKGDYEKSHAHLKSDEITIIAFGTVKMNDKEYGIRSIIVQEKGEFTDFECISDTCITIVYRPDGSYPDDKIFKEE